MAKRVFLIVLDSFGIGQMPDAAEYGDKDVNTLGSVSESMHFHMPNIQDPEFQIGCPLEFLPPEVYEFILNAERRSIDS